MNPCQTDGLSEANGIPEPWAEGQGGETEAQITGSEQGVREPVLRPGLASGRALLLASQTRLDSAGLQQYSLVT